MGRGEKFKMWKFFPIFVLAIAAISAGPATAPSTKPGQSQQDADREGRRIGAAIAQARIVYGMTLDEAKEAVQKGNRNVWARVTALRPGENVYCDGHRDIIDHYLDGKPANENIMLVEGPAGAWVVKVKYQDRTVLIAEQIGWNRGVVQSRLAHHPGT